MTERKNRLIIAAIWQLVRFIIVGIGAVFFFNPSLVPGFSVFLLWSGSGSLVLVAGFFIAGIQSHHFASLRSFLLLGKILEIVPGIILMIVQARSLIWGLGTPLFKSVAIIDTISNYQLNTTVLFYYIIGVLILIDLIFLLLLLSCKLERGNDESPVSHQEKSHLICTSSVTEEE